MSAPGGPRPPTRRVARLCKHLEPDRTGAAAAPDRAASAAELSAILETLGPQPLSAASRAMLYVVDAQLPSLEERKSRAPPELV